MRDQELSFDIADKISIDIKRGNAATSILNAQRSDLDTAPYFYVNLFLGL